MSVTKQTVNHIAKLSMLKISDTEQEAVTETINKVLSFVDTLQDVDTTGIDPLAHPLEANQRLREDVAAEASTEKRDALLSNAPDQIDGQFIVPRVVE